MFERILLAVDGSEHALHATLTVACQVLHGLGRSAQCAADEGQGCSEQSTMKEFLAFHDKGVWNVPES